MQSDLTFHLQQQGMWPGGVQQPMMAAPGAQMMPAAMQPQQQQSQPDPFGAL